MRIAFAPRFCNQWSKWADNFSWVRMPVKPIMTARRAAKMLCILHNAISRAIDAGVLTLGIDISVANADGVQFVASDPAIKNLFLAGLGVKKPLAIAFNQRDREWPRVVADVEVDSGVGFRHRDNAFSGQAPGKMG